MPNSMLPLRYPRFWRTLGWVFVVFAMLACLAPATAPGMNELFAVNDKVEHALGYTALTLWFAGLYSRSRYLWIAVGLFSMGVIIEFLQGWMALGRNRDPLDVLANTTGIVIGLVLAWVALGGWMQRVETYFAKRER